MITFFVSIIVLILGYFLYSKVVERIFVIDPNRATPATALADGVDFVAMPGWKIFLIQFLNIAGLGPIFGAVAGAMWGPVAFLWIVLGSIFAGPIIKTAPTMIIRTAVKPRMNCFTPFPRYMPEISDMLFPLCLMESIPEK